MQRCLEKRLLPYAAVALFSLTATALASGAASSGKGDLPRLETLEGSRVSALLPPDAIPAIDTPQFVSASEASAFMKDDEPVLGVMHDGAAKAYSLWHLDRHEIVSDRLGSQGVAVTW
jgi:hypothetical protein